MSPPLPPPPSTSYLSSIGLGYSIAIALGFLVLFSSLLLASYICLRASRNRSRNQNNNNNNNRTTTSTTTISDDGGIIVPRIIFVAEGDDDNEDESNQNLVVGLDENVINSYPKFVYTKNSSGRGGGGFTGNTISNCNSNSNDINNDNSNSTMCSICLCEYKDLEMLRMMPECRHYFHLCCLDAWLRLNGSCPVCRNSPLPTPLSTPLSEVVPLSQYGDDRRRRRR